MSSQSSITGQSSAASSSFKSTTVSITVQQQEQDLLNTSTPEFTTLIASEKSLLSLQHNNERETNQKLHNSSTTTTSSGSTIILLTNEQTNSPSSDLLYEEDYDEEVQCDQEINRITNNSTGKEIGGGEKVTVMSTSSPEPSGNHELVMMRRGQEDTDDGGGGVEFQEFVMGEDDVGLSFRVSSSSTSSSKMMKSSKTIQSSFSSKSSIQQQSSVEKVSSIAHQQSEEKQLSSSAVVSAVKDISSNQQVIETSANQAVTMTNGSGQVEEGTGKKEKKTKVERKTSKAGAGKKSKSNAEISKENISVTNVITNGSSTKFNTINNKEEDLVKKLGAQLGPGESRVFAKVCVANLRRSFGDLTVINSAISNDNGSAQSNYANNDGQHQLMMMSKYSGSNSLEYNRVNSSSNNTDLKKSSFSKFDSLVSKIQQQQQQKFEKESNGGGKMDQESGKAEGKKMFCEACEKQVFQMELIRAEKMDWHKNCFRCQSCRKVLSVDTYQSHEKKLYCKPHFKELFQPKVVMDGDGDGELKEDVDIEDGLSRNKKSKLQLIICESQPKELPPDVVRASDAPTTGLEDIQIDVRSKFEMFENFKEKSGEKSPVEPIPVKRSASVLAKLKKYENSAGNGGLNGVSDEDLHGVDGIELQSDEEEGIELEEGENSVIKDEVKRKLKNPLQALNEIAHFKQMEQVRNKWEGGSFTRDQISAEQKKQELQKFRSRLCHGKSGHLKEMYEKGMETSGEGQSEARSEIEELKVEKAKAFREMFEKGEVGRRRYSSGDDGEEGEGEDERDGGTSSGRSKVDMEVFEAGVAKESKRLFEEMDKRVVNEMKEQKNVPKNSARFVEKKHNSALVSGIQQQLATSPGEVVKSSDKSEAAKVNTEELSSKFKFFETYEDEIAKKAKEGKRETFKRITPPREDGVVKTEKDYDDSESDSPQTYRDPNVVRHGEDNQEDPLQHSKTTSKMLSVFRQMEENLSKGENGPIIRPLKQFTPPRDTVGSGGGMRDNSDEDEEEEEEEEDEEEEEEDTEEAEKRMSEDDFLKEVGSLARARSLRAKFERWEQQENERNKQGLVQDELAESIESAKNLKAKFEAMRLMDGAQGSNKENLKGNSPVPIRVNRFVLNANNHQQDSNSSNSASTSPQQLYCSSNNNNFSSLPAALSNGTSHSNNNNMSSNEQCALCEKRVYVMEKVEAGGKMYHKNCFRCSQCKSILRMDTFTSNKGTLFCTTHFKQLFKIKGNYDEGFGHETQYQTWAKNKAAAQQN